MKKYKCSDSATYWINKRIENGKKHAENNPQYKITIQAQKEIYQRLAHYMINDEDHARADEISYLLYCGEKNNCFSAFMRIIEDAYYLGVNEGCNLKLPNYNRRHN